MTSKIEKALRNLEYKAMRAYNENATVIGFLDIPILNFFITESAEHAARRAMEQKACAGRIRLLVSSENLTDETYIPHVLKLAGLNEKAVENERKFENSELGMHFASLNMGGCDTCDWGGYPYLTEYIQFALDVFEEELSTEDRLQLEAAKVMSF